MDKGKTRQVYSTALPYPSATWPVISSHTSDNILQFLLPLLNPIGESRRDQVTPSKGKGRSKKRQKHEAVETTMGEFPPLPHMTIGFNSTMRQLEELAKVVAKPKAETSDSASEVENETRGPAVVFARKSTLPGPVSQSIPLLVAAASIDLEPIRLVEISSEIEAAHSSALGIHRVSMLGISSESPGADALINYIRQQIEPIDAPWLRATTVTPYLPLKIHTDDVGVKIKQQKRKRKAQPD